uniref:Uncharacterized protein n=1 Tax=Myoviridae sp. ctnjE18 TaxID=2827706 RepID=A0A8S5STN9_9CAUD|nr:MAG TPA: hypothetical protein [Myoviridae sp. ctnjE18]
MPTKQCAGNLIAPGASWSPKLVVRGSTPHLHAR